MSWSCFNWFTKIGGITSARLETYLTRGEHIQHIQVNNNSDVLLLATGTVRFAMC